MNVGDRFSGLVIIGPIVTRGKHSYSMCRCDCGKEWMARRDAIKSGETTSCGCMRRSAFVKRSTTHGAHSRGVRSVEYQSWDSMIQRTCNPNSDVFKHYGERGITVCARWRESFSAFLEDMGPRPAGMELERIDNDRGYETGNCRWATRFEQMQNTRWTRLIDRKSDAKFSVRHSCKLAGINPQKVYWRVWKYGMTHQAAFDEVMTGAPQQ